MSLGAHEFARLTSEGREIGLTFKARILPFTKAGTRSPRPRIMRVTVELNHLDYYDVRVLYTARGQLIGVVCGRGRNPTLRLWPAIFSGEIDVFPSERRNMGQEIGR